MIRVNIKQIASVSYERYSPANDQLLKKKERVADSFRCIIKRSALPQEAATGWYCGVQTD